jgi:hypothetical protein
MGMLVNFHDAAASTKFAGYSISQGAIPVTDYFATFAVLADDENASIVEWSGEFTPDGVSDLEAEAFFLGFYEDGLEALKANFV